MAAILLLFSSLALLMAVQAQVPNRMIMCDTEQDVLRCNIYCSRQQEGGYGVCDYGVCHCYPGPAQPQRPQPPVTETTVTGPTVTEATPSINETTVEGGLDTRIQGPVLGTVSINIRCNTRGLLNHPLYCPFWCVNAGFFDGFCSKNYVCSCWQYI